MAAGSTAAILPKGLFTGGRKEKRLIKASPLLIEAAEAGASAAIERLRSRAHGLTNDEAKARLEEFGPNVLAKDRRTGIARLLWHAIINPLVVLLAVLSAISFATGDSRAGIVMALMILLGVSLKLVQEAKADRAAARLKAMISVTATVMRDGNPVEVPVAELVPGDVVRLAAGDMVPGDVRIVSAKDLFVIQSSLAGESFPVEKFEVEKTATAASPTDLTSVAFLGTSVESGSAVAVVVATGASTYLGGMAEALSEQPTETAFDRGIASFTWLMVRFILVMVPVVFLVNGITKGNWTEAFFFAVAVAVGLDARDAADDRYGLPVEGRHRDEPQEGDRQTHQRHPEPGRDGRAVHGQDGYPHSRSRHPRTALRCRPPPGRRRAHPGVPEQLFPDGAEERPRPRGPRPRGGADGDADRRIHEGR